MDDMVVPARIVVHRRLIMRRHSFAGAARRTLLGISVFLIAGLAPDGPSGADAVAEQAGRIPVAEVSASAAAEIIDPWTQQEDRLRERLLAIAGEYVSY